MQFLGALTSNFHNLLEFLLETQIKPGYLSREVCPFPLSCVTCDIQLLFDMCLSLSLLSPSIAPDSLSLSLATSPASVPSPFFPFAISRALASGLCRDAWVGLWGDHSEFSNLCWAESNVELAAYFSVFDVFYSVGVCASRKS